MNFILIKPIFLQINKKIILLKLIKNPAYDLNVRLSEVFNINQDIIQIYNNKDIKLFSQYFINISLKDSQGIG